MQMKDIVDYARRMYDQAGPKAIAIAATKARECTERGENTRAEDWRKIQRVLLERSGPRYS